MILEEATKEAFGYYPRDLALFSEDPILAKCSRCNRTRTTLKNRCDLLCYSCAEDVRRDTKNSNVKRTTIRCLTCGKEFGAAKKSSRKYCCQECAEEAQERERDILEAQKGEREILEKAFNYRWSSVTSKGDPTKEDKINLLSEVIRTYTNGFYCKYCGVKMVIKGGCNAFSLDHKDGETDVTSIDNFEIVCIGCNILKGSIIRDNFIVLVSTLKSIHGNAFYQEIKRQKWAGIQKGIKKAKSEGKVCHRHEKKINISRIKKNMIAGMLFTEIALVENISISTLRIRMKKLGISKTKSLKK